MLQLTIPNPCNENWDNMTPDGNGRHCGQCAKTVIDFTKMTNQQIQEIFTQKNSLGICGRFNKIQLKQAKIELPQNIFYIYLPLYKRFLVASLLVFSATLFSCEVKTTGESVNIADFKINKKSMVITGDTILIEKAIDTIPLKNRLLGKPAICTPPNSIDIKGDVVSAPVHIIKQVDVEQRILVGEPVIESAKDSVIIEKASPEIMGKMIAVPVNKLKNN